MLEKILARTCYKLAWKKLGLVMLCGFLFVTIGLCMVLRPYVDPPPSFEVPPYESFEPFLAPIMCNISGEKSDFCELAGDIRIHGNSSSILFNSPNKVLENNNTWGIKLYARKSDRTVMRRTKQVWLKVVLPSQFKDMPQCTVNHSLPVIIFSTGGYAGNIFHDTSDVLIPLYLTSLQFNGEVQFVAQDRHSWWIKRHIVTLKALSKSEIIDLDRDNEIRCFTKAMVGLRSHKDFGIDPAMVPYGLTLRNFTEFTRKIYSLERTNAINMIAKETQRRPRLLIISRKKTRVILNEDELIKQALGLGYDVNIIDARIISLEKFSKIVNSIDVMIGVHGAGLTNMIYLPENAILVQIVPLGLETLSNMFYKQPAIDMNLKYLEYKVSEKESSLIHQYPIKMNLNWTKKEGWEVFKRTYLDNQDVRLDMSRFKIVLLKAMELLRHQS